MDRERKRHTVGHEGVQKGAEAAEEMPDFLPLQEELPNFANRGNPQ